MRLSFIETEQARPVVVMPDSGGAAYDIYRFWTRGELPVVLPDGSNDGYVALCEELLPLIREVGSENTGANQVCPLSFFHIGSDAEGYAHTVRPFMHFKTLQSTCIPLTRSPSLSPQCKCSPSSQAPTYPQSSSTSATTTY